MERTTSTSQETGPTTFPGATIHPLRPIRRAAEPATAPEPHLEGAGERVAQAMSALLRVQRTDRAGTMCETRGLASSQELTRMIDIFLSIHGAATASQFCVPAR